LKKFTGTIKPFFSLDGLGITIKYGEIVSLEEWQINHPSFKFAADNGWVVAVDRKTLVFNPVSSPRRVAERKPDRKPLKLKTISAEITDLPETGVDPTLIHEILARQDVFVKQAQKTFERLTNQKKEPEAAVSPELLASLLENQKKMMDMLEKERAAKAAPAPSSPAPDQTTLMQALKLLTNEVKKLQEVKPVEAASVDTNQLLEGVKQVMSQFSPGSGYNQSKKADPTGFKVRDDFEEKFIPKVEDLEVKHSKIVTQEKDSGSVEEALAALRKLKEKK
jgi:hypothetical protein